MLEEATGYPLNEDPRIAALKYADSLGVMAMPNRRAIEAAFRAGTIWQARMSDPITDDPSITHEVSAIHRGSYGFAECTCGYASGWIPGEEVCVRLWWHLARHWTDDAEMSPELRQTIASTVHTAEQRSGCTCPKPANGRLNLSHTCPVHTRTRLPDGVPLLPADRRV